LAFRRVKEQTFPDQPAGTSTLSIALSDDRGSLLANGLYYAVIQTNRGEWVKKLLVLR
jgi:hypothetical protein